MNDWWNGIPTNQKVYWFLAFPFTAMFIIQTLMTFIGIGGESDGADINEDVDIHPNSNHLNESYHAIEDTVAPFKLLTLRNIIVFFTVFSWSGITALKSGLSDMLAFIVSCILSFTIAIILSSIFYFVTRLTNSGTLDLENAISCIGEVYLTIPEKNKGTGKVLISIQGALRELDALTEGEELSTGTKVIVTQIINNQYLLVRRYN